MTVGMKRYFLSAGAAFAAAAVALALFASCSHKVSDSVRSKSDTVALVHVRTDSIFLKDSVFVDRNTYVRGDTVYRIVSRVQYKDRWRTKIKTDTVYRSVRDTVSVEVPVRVMERVRWYDKGFMWIGRACCMAALLWAVFLYLKRKI